MKIEFCPFQEIGGTKTRYSEVKQDGESIGHLFFSEIGIYEGKEQELWRSDSQLLETLNLKEKHWHIGAQQHPLTVWVPLIRSILDSGTRLNNLEKSLEKNPKFAQDLSAYQGNPELEALIKEQQEKDIKYLKRKQAMKNQEFLKKPIWCKKPMYFGMQYFLKTYSLQDFDILDNLDNLSNQPSQRS